MQNITGYKVLNLANRKSDYYSHNERDVVRIAPLATQQEVHVMTHIKIGDIESTGNSGGQLSKEEKGNVKGGSGYLISPGSLRAFNLQPEPPTKGAFGSIRGFNPQPEPPTMGSHGSIKGRSFRSIKGR